MVDITFILVIEVTHPPEGLFEFASMLLSLALEGVTLMDDVEYGLIGPLAGQRVVAVGED